MLSCCKQMPTTVSNMAKSAKRCTRQLGLPPEEVLPKATRLTASCTCATLALHSRSTAPPLLAACPSTGERAPRGSTIYIASSSWPEAVFTPTGEW